MTRTGPCSAGWGVAGARKEKKEARRRELEERGGEANGEKREKERRRMRLERKAAKENLVSRVSSRAAGTERRLKR